METLSIEPAIIPKIAKYWACRSLGIICVEIVSGLNLSFFAVNIYILGSTFAYVPTAPEIAHVETSCIASFNRFSFLLNSA